MSVFELREGTKLKMFVPPETWCQTGEVVDVEVRSVGLHRRRDGKIDETLGEAVLVPSADSGVPGSPTGVMLFVVRRRTE